MTGRRGFTLIELLIVVLVIAILASLAITNMARSRERAFYATVKQDLKNLGSAMEVYYSKSHQYTSDLGQIGWQPSEGVTLNPTSIMMQQNNQGWGIWASHRAIKASPDHCAIYGGAVDFAGPGLADGKVGPARVPYCLE